MFQTKSKGSKQIQEVPHKSKQFKKKTKIVKTNAKNNLKLIIYLNSFNEQ